MENRKLIVGFTGTQQGMSNSQKEQVRCFLQNNNVIEFHHGDCLGADSEAHDIAVELKIPVVIHPPTVWRYRAFKQNNAKIHVCAPYLRRNHDIVDACSVLLVCSRTSYEILRSGTWATYRYAIKQKVKTIVYLP